MTPRYRIDGDIGDQIRSADVAAWLMQYEGRAVQIDLHTNGGDTDEGMSIYHAIATHRGLTTCLVTGVAASMGSIILQAFDVRKVARGSYVMIHNPHVNGCRLEETDLRDVADYLRRVKSDMIEIYARRSRRSRAEIEALMQQSRETWLSAEEAVAAGLADVVEDVEARGVYQACARAKTAPPGAIEAARRRAAARARACIARHGGRARF